jgi:formylmethanofuran dehydrogenase subunit A
MVRLEAVFQQDYNYAGHKGNYEVDRQMIPSQETVKTSVRENRIYIQQRKVHVLRTLQSAQAGTLWRKSSSARPHKRFGE